MLNKFINFIDGFLNKITMYKLVLYILIALVFIAVLLSSFGIIPYSPLALIFSVLLITTICFVANSIFAWAFEAPTNVESVYITALILALIITPMSNPSDFAFISLAVWAGIWAMASKFIFALYRKHIWNPAAFAVVLTAITGVGYASWWVGTISMAPFVLVGGLLIARKIHRFDLVVSSVVASIIMLIVLHINDLANVGSYLWRLLALSPMLFYVLFMLTEPLTTSPKRWSRIIYGIIAGILVVPSIHFGSVNFTPELALIVANIFAYIASPKKKLLLRLKEKVLVANDTYDFRFQTDTKFDYEAGQYLEWTLDRETRVDSRGNRRYFTISSSPTEDSVSMGIKFYPEPSTFKKNLLAMNAGDTIVASQLSGDFVLPSYNTKKLVFIAGGIGITPFRSMIKYLVDKGEKRDIILLYSNRTSKDVAYKEIFEKARIKLGIKTKYVITDKGSEGFTGFIDAKMIMTEIPDFKDRYFYISGPHGMITLFEKTLSDIGVKKSHIVTDYFPGFA